MEENIGRKIRSLREQAGLTQEDVAEAMDVSRQAVSKWEANLSRPSAENLIRLAHLLNVDLAELIGAPEREETGEGAAAEGAPKTPGKRWPWILGIVLLLVLAVMVGTPLVAFFFFTTNTQAS